MRHIIAIFTKFFLTAFVVLSIFQMVPGSSLNTMLFSALFITAVGYLLGDLVLLPRMGNAGATIVDFGLVLLTLFVVGFFTTGISLLFTIAAVSTAFLIAVSESFLHFFVQSIIGEQRAIYEKPSIISARLNTRLQTEFAEENDVHDIKKQVDKNKNDSD